MDKGYGGVVWTKHALDRLKSRGIKQGDAWATWRNPDQSRYATTKSAWIYYRNIGESRIEVVAKQNEKGKWVILSVWSKLVKGTKVNREKTRSFMGKIFELFSR